MMDALDSIIQEIHHYLNQQPSDNSLVNESCQCSEHALIQHLKNENIAPFSEFRLQQSKDLFSAHFLTKHALYHLQNRYHQEQSYLLDISAVRIVRSPYYINEGHCSDGSVTKHDSLKDYYLNIQHYFETDEDEVNILLNSFWQKFLAQDDKQEALAELELPDDADYPAIKKKYRILAQQHHPDKGGCSKKFVRINAAKKLLDTVFN